MISVREMQMAIDEVADVIAMRDRLVAAPRAMHMPFLMASA